MTTSKKSKYSKRTNIQERKLKHLIKCFSLDLNAYKTYHIKNVLKLHIYIYKNLLFYVDDEAFEWDAPQKNFLHLN